MQCFVFFFRNLRMSDKEGSGSEGSLEEENYEVEEIREKMRGDDGVWLYYVKVCSCDAAHFFSQTTRFSFSVGRMGIRHKYLGARRAFQ